MNESIPSCEHDQTEVRTQTVSNGSTRYIRQCLNCGQSIGQAISKAGTKIKPTPFDVELREQWNAQQHDAYEQLRAKQTSEQRDKSSEWWKRYREYLKSDQWQRVSRFVIMRDGVCQACFKYKPTQAHHLSYATFNKYGFSFAQECVGLCAQCHLDLHNDYPDDVPMP